MVKWLQKFYRNISNKEMAIKMQMDLLLSTNILRETDTRFRLSIRKDIHAAAE